jgi:hypothetical protein
MGHDGRGAVGGGGEMLKDLSALTPPFLVAVAFLVAAGAFVRHEMRGSRNRAEDDSQPDSGPDSMPEGEEDAAAGRGPARPSFRDKLGDGAQD